MSKTLDAMPPHPFEGVVYGTPDRPCTRCGLSDRDPIHKVSYDPPRITPLPGDIGGALKATHHTAGVGTRSETLFEVSYGVNLMDALKEFRDAAQRLIDWADSDENSRCVYCNVGNGHEQHCVVGQFVEAFNRVKPKTDDRTPSNVEQP